ncbi:MAG: VWA domain-containing protein [Alphaproteobacteria bacterium]|nr:VWA domain-containing protein [Alphaproteobacteria bacterium]
MPTTEPGDHALPAGRLADNIMHFARTLRAAGLPLGPGRVIEAIRAVEAAGVARRDDFYWALHAVFVNRREQRELFDQAFHVFWRDPQLLERMLALLLPSVKTQVESDRSAISRRMREALAAGRRPGQGEGERPPEDRVELDAAMSFSEREVLRAKDFDEMSVAELKAARALIARLHLPLATVPTRRFRSTRAGSRIDLRATLRAALRGGSDVIPLRFRRRRDRPPAIVLICDISGSMARYAEMLIHFAHALTSDRDRVHTFLFGTRLTNVTRYLRARDVDVALRKVAQSVEDWSGGTRIGACLHAFNRRWSRRVLAQGAIVLLVSDGLDRDPDHALAAEAERLHKSCRRLIWLNPLLRYDGFEPKSWGIRAILPHVDEFRPAHNIQSLADLAAALGRADRGRNEELRRWAMAS